MSHWLPGSPEKQRRVGMEDEGPPYRRIPHPPSDLHRPNLSRGNAGRTPVFPTTDSLAYQESVQSSFCVHSSYNMAAVSRAPALCSL